MFGMLKEKLGGAVNRLSGKTDLLEGIAAGAILVSAADGEIESEEIAVLVEALCANETLSKSFTDTQITGVVDKMVKKASPNAAGKIGMVGKIALEREVAELLDTSVASVNSALQRARAGLREHLPAERQDWAAGGGPR